MGFLDRMFRRVSNEMNFWNNAPFICPWSFDKKKPAILKNGQLLNWKYIEKIKDKYVGIVVLQNKDGDKLGVLNAYTYLYSNITGDKFLIWNREWKDENGAPKITIELFRTSDLNVVNDFEQTVIHMGNYTKTDYYFNAQPSDKVEFILSADKPIRTTFGQEFREFNDFCIVNDIPGLYKNGNESFGNTVIALVNIKSGDVFIYPQDWFNKSEKIDFGYQWLTRAQKDTQTNLIHGQGIRMNDFVLDETNRRLK